MGEIILSWEAERSRVDHVSGSYPAYIDYTKNALYFFVTQR